jgi:hypothetical protein
MSPFVILLNAEGHLKFEATCIATPKILGSGSDVLWVKGRSRPGYDAASRALIIEANLDAKIRTTLLCETHRSQSRVAFYIICLKLLRVSGKLGSIAFKAFDLVFSVRDYCVLNFVKFFGDSHSNRPFVGLATLILTKDWA